MNTKDRKFIERLCRSILAGTFAYKKYLQRGKTWYGRETWATMLHCSYGTIGYTVSFPYDYLPSIEYDWETDKITIQETDFEDYIKNIK